MPREVKGHLLRALAYALVLEAMLAAAILYWPEFERNIPSVLKLVPGRIMGGFVTAIARGGAPAYAVLQHFFKGCHMLGGAAAVLFAAGAIAGEAHRGTLEILLARPLTRRRILSERFALGALAVALPVFATSASIPWLFALVDEEVRLAPFLLGAAHESVFLLSIYSATFLLSAVGRNPTSIAFGMILLLVLEFATYLVMEATHVSIFRWADLEDFERILSTGALDWKLLSALLAFSGACLFVSFLAFERRVP